MEIFLSGEKYLFIFVLNDDNLSQVLQLVRTSNSVTLKDNYKLGIFDTTVVANCELQ